MQRTKSNELFEKAKNLFPGGVNSPVRAFKAVMGSPLFIKEGKGAYITDEDDNTYIDFCCSYGPLILGHAHEDVVKAVSETAAKGTTYGAPTQLENELAELVLQRNTFIDKIRFVNSGTEAVMSAIRLARGYTGRNKVIKFEGCYHGHVDSLLVKAGSGLVTFGESSSAGVPNSFTAETLVLPLNNKEAIEEALKDHKDDIACIIIEPIPANNGLLLQDKEYLSFLRTVCDEHGILLIFDEVISGFRVRFGGATEYYGITPDIVTYGKIIGGGLPVGAYGAKNHIMKSVSPEGPVYQAGTLSGNPIAMAAGLAQIKACNEDGFYENQEAKTKHFVGLVNTYAKEKNYTFELFSIGSIFWIAFSDKKAIRRSDEIDASSMDLFKKLHNHLLELGVYVGPSGYEVGFISSAHTDEVLEDAAKKMMKALDLTFK